MRCSCPLILFGLGMLVHSQVVDYVIVGAGTSGLVIANRLSENPDICVTVVEPGDDVRNNPNVTSVAVGLNIDPSTDWSFYSRPQAKAGNRTLVYHAGRAIGGTSVINGRQYLRGDKAEYDAWETLGNEGWNWETMLEHFKISENFTYPTAAQLAAGATFRPEYHGRQGYLKTGYLYNLPNGSIHNASQQTWNSLGYDVNLDPNDGETAHFGVYPSTIDRDANIREDAARAYYHPVESRSNLKIIKGTMTKMTWEKESGDAIVASGVEYLDSSGKLRWIGASKDVIISAGTLRSPLALEASGIGNPSILSSFGIETKVDLPAVGESMQDPQLATMGYASTVNLTGQALSYVVYATVHDIFGSDAASVADATNASLASWARSVAAHTAHADAVEARFRVQHGLMFRENATMAEISMLSVGDVLATTYQTLLPFSWGRVHLGAGGGASGAPIIDANFLNVEFDLDVLRAAGRLVLRAWDTEPLSRFAAARFLPPADQLSQNSTDEQWDSYHLTEGAGSTWHSIGTCAMLPRDLGGVVDARLKVYGTRNVRVVDASVVPIQMSGHPTATLYAMAERAARLIQEDWSS